MLWRRRAQSLGEYTITISLVILAIMAMTYFIQRGLAARINDARGYMLDTLHPETEQIRFWRGGKLSPTVRAEYEPYYVDKTADMSLSPETKILINGPADTYISTSKTATGINSVSRELPPEDFEP